jgi:hypothetical protein
MFLHLYIRNYIEPEASKTHVGREKQSSVGLCLNFSSISDYRSRLAVRYPPTTIGNEIKVEIL